MRDGPALRDTITFAEESTACEPTAHGSNSPFDKLTALSKAEGLTVPERSRREKPCCDGYPPAIGQS